MSEHDKKSPPAITYGARDPITGFTLTCDRCKRAYAYPTDGATIRCECGWRYANRDGVIHEEFTPRLGV
ncbi:MAG: hypothetical protein NVS2B3_06790 [Vulcanimicrobiaceae bacterium]